MKRAVGVTGGKRGAGLQVGTSHVVRTVLCGGSFGQRGLLLGWGVCLFNGRLLPQDFL